MDNKKKILHIRYSLDFGGVTMMELNWARSLREQYQFDFLLDCEDNPRREAFEKLGSEIYVISKFKKGNLIKKIKYKIRLMYNYVHFFKTHNYNVIHINAEGLQRIDVLICAAIAGVKKRIVHSHNSLPHENLRRGIWKKKWFQKIIRECIWLFSTDRAACSREAAAWFFPCRKLDEVTIVVNGFYVEKYMFNEFCREGIRKRLKLDNGFVIGLVGRLSKQKNHKYMLDVFSKLVKIKTNSKLLLCGEGELETEIRDKTIELGIEDKVLFIKNQENICNYYSAMDCFVLPSVFEGLGIVGVEAQAAGLPCVISDAVPKEIKVLEDVKFLPITLEAVEDWVEALENIEVDFDKRKEADKIILQSQYNIAFAIKKLQEIYEG